MNDFLADARLPDEGSYQIWLTVREGRPVFEVRTADGTVLQDFGTEREARSFAAERNAPSQRGPGVF